MVFIFLQQEAVEEHLSLKQEKIVRKRVEQNLEKFVFMEKLWVKVSSGLYPGCFCWDRSSGSVYILQVEAGPL